MKSVQGKTVLITGAAMGMGRLFAERAIAEKAKAVVLWDLNEPALQRTLEELSGGATEVTAYLVDVGNLDAVTASAAAVLDEVGRVDVLVNNAGMSPLYPSLDAVTEELFDKVIGVNLKGPFRLSSIVGTRMAAGAGGSIINISSIASQRPSPGEAPYGAAKAGVNSLTQSMAAAFGPKVRVNCIVPGPFLTDISKAWDMEAFNARAKSAFALGRGGQPHEIVGAALYLASEASSYTTGAFINIDGLPR